MNPGKSGNIKSVDEDIRQAAVEAAQKSGLSLDEWLNRTIADLAVKDFGKPEAGQPAAATQDDLAALTGAVTRLTRRIRTMDSGARSSVSGLKGRLGEIEARLARAHAAEPSRRDESLKGVAALVDRLARDLNNADETARALVEGIGARAPAPPAQPPADNVGEAMRDLDAQIAEIAGRLRVPPAAQVSQAASVRANRLDDLKTRLDSLLARAPESARVEPPAERAASLDSTLRALEERLNDRSTRPAAPPAPPPAPSRVHLAPEEDERLRRIESQLTEIGTRLTEPPRREPDPKHTEKHDELESAIAAIAAEQQRAIGEKAEIRALRQEQKTVVDALAALSGDVAELSIRVSEPDRSVDLTALRREQKTVVDALSALSGDVAELSLRVAEPDRGADLAALRREQRQMSETLSALATSVMELGASAAEQQRAATNNTELAALRREQRQVTDALASVSTELSDLVARVTDIGRKAPADDALQALTRRIDALTSERPTEKSNIADMRHQLEALRSETAREDTLLGRFDDLVSNPPERERLDILAAELAAVRDLIENDESPKAVARLEMRVSEIGRSVEATMHSREAAAEVSAVGLAAAMADIRGAIEDIATTDRATDRYSMADFAAGLADIRHAIEARQASPTATDEPAIVRLENRFDEIAARIDGVLDRAVPTEMFTDLQARLTTLVARLDTLHLAAGHPAAVDEIKAEIAAIRTNIHAQEPPRLDYLEGQVRDLADRLDSVIRPDADPRHLADLEARVSRLAEELAGATPPNAALRHVEENLMRLQAHLSDSRAESVAAARSAAREAVREFAGSRVEADLVRNLRSELDQVRSAVGRSDDRTRETLGEVNTTLDTIANRLGKIEDDEPQPAAATTAAEPASPGINEPLTGPLDFATRLDAAARRGSEAPAVKPDLAALRELASSADPERKSADRRADFIAAARRAAQAAVAEAGAVESTSGPKPGAFSRIGQAIRNRRRPLLLAAAAIVLAIGALHLFGQRSEQSGNVAAAAPTAKPAVVAPQTPPKAMAQADKAPAPTIPSVEDTALVAPAANARAAMALAAAPVDGRFGDAFSGEVANGFNASAAEADGTVITASTAGSATAGLPLLGSDKLRAAATSGDPAAAYEIATRFAEGRNVERNLGVAAKWYEQAAKAGIAVAEYRLGSLYERGQGVDKDLGKAVGWYQKAADQGNIGAMHNLAVLMSEGVDGKPDEAKALEWFLAAANYGVKDSQYNLGVIYARGIGAEADLIESYKWFAAAAAQGDTDAAGRREEVAGMLDQDKLAKARAVATAWRAKPALVEANTVKAPDGGWDGTSDAIAESDKAALVKKIQTLLADQGFDPGPADGVDGPKTREAVKAFQRQIGLVDTGVLDGKLVTALADRASSG